MNHRNRAIFLFTFPFPSPLPPLPHSRQEMLFDDMRKHSYITIRQLSNEYALGER